MFVTCFWIANFVHSTHYFECLTQLSSDTNENHRDMNSVRVDACQTFYCAMLC